MGATPALPCLSLGTLSLLNIATAPLDAVNCSHFLSRFVKLNILIFLIRSKALSYFERDMVYVYAYILKLLLKNTFASFSKWLQIVRTKDMELGFNPIIHFGFKAFS